MPSSTTILQQEEFELDEQGLLRDLRYEAYTARYEDGRSIDWQREEAAERTRTAAQVSRRGIRGLLLLWLDSARMWLIVVANGLGIGLAGAWLDVLVEWHVLLDLSRTISHSFSG